MALILGIESSCDETAAAVIDSEGASLASRIVAQRIASQDDAHRPYGGVVPEIAARAHAERLAPMIAAVLKEGRVALADLDAHFARAYVASHSDLSTLYPHDELAALEHYFSTGHAEGRRDMRGDQRTARRAGRRPSRRRSPSCAVRSTRRGPNASSPAPRLRRWTTWSIFISHARAWMHASPPRALRVSASPKRRITPSPATAPVGRRPMPGCRRRQPNLVVRQFAQTEHRL